MHLSLAPPVALWLVPEKASLWLPMLLRQQASAADWSQGKQNDLVDFCVVLWRQHANLHLSSFAAQLVALQAL